MKSITDQDLIDLIDLKVTVAQKKELMDLIEQNAELRKRYHVLKALHNDLENITLEQASHSFSDKVMANLHNPEYLPEIIATPFSRRNLFTFLTIFAGILVGIYILSTGIISIPFFDKISVQPVNLRGNEINVTPWIDTITSSLLFKIFILADIVLGWFLLDRMVLKPYFANRKKRLAY